MANIKPIPYAHRPEEGPILPSFGTSIKVLARSDQTGGAFNLFIVTCSPGYATPLHIHYAEDVAVYVLEGRLTFFWGNEKMAAEAGSFFFQPRDIPHGFRVDGNESARIFYLTLPAGFDQFVREQDGSISCLAAEAAAARYKIEILGPLST